MARRERARFTPVFTSWVTFTHTPTYVAIGALEPIVRDVGPRLASSLSLRVCLHITLFLWIFADNAAPPLYPSFVRDGVNALWVPGLTSSVVVARRGPGGP